MAGIDGYEQPLNFANDITSIFPTIYEFSKFILTKFGVDNTLHHIRNIFLKYVQILISYYE